MDLHLLWIWAGVFVSLCSGNEVCVYRKLTEYMDCKNLNLGEIKRKTYPVNESSIKDLVLHHNGILRLEYDTFYDLPNLLTLDLSDNLLSTLDYRLFMEMLELETLNLRNNRLTSLQDGRIFMNQKKLNSLILDFNRIMHLDESVLLPLESLNKLFIISNSFVCDCDLRKTVLWCQSKGLEVAGFCENPQEYRNSSWNVLIKKDCNKIENKNIIDMTTLDNGCNYNSSSDLLNCSSVHLKQLTSTTFPNTLTVHTLLAKDCALSNVQHNALVRFTTMQYLDLSRNSLDILDHRVFSRLSQLKELILSENNFVSLPENLFMSQKQLRILDLHNNHLTSLKAELFIPLVSLQHLNLSLNGFFCDCEIIEVILWCEKKGLSTEAKCEFPRKLSGYSWTAVKNETECIQTTTPVIFIQTTQHSAIVNNSMDTLLIALIVVGVLFLIAIIAAMWVFCRKINKNTEDYIYDDVGNCDETTNQNGAWGEMKVLKNPLKLEKNEMANLDYENTYEDIDTFRSRKNKCDSYEVPIHLLEENMKKPTLNNEKQDNRYVPSYMEVREAENKPRKENLYVLN